MSVFEKSIILGSIGFVGCFSLYTIFAPGSKSLTKEDMQIKRERILQSKDMRILYSTMTFFYLQGFEQEKAQSFFNLHDILEVSKPKLVAIQLSSEEYNEKYQSILQNPKFPDAMNKVSVILKNKDEEKLKAMEQEIELKNLEKLYLFDYCKKNKCQVLFADKGQEELDKIYQAKSRLQKLTIEKSNSIPDHLNEFYDSSDKQKIIDKQQEDKKKDNSQASKTIGSSAKQLLNMTKEDLDREVFQETRQQFFVDRIMDELKPKYSLLPSNPYKTIVGVVDPEHVNPIAKKWKNNFKSVYGHEILEDESVAGKFDDEEDYQ